MVAEMAEVDTASCAVPPSVLMRAAIALHMEANAREAVIGVRSRPCELVAVYRFSREMLHDVGANLAEDMTQGKALLPTITGA